ncbi:MAG: hypothetical protein ISQ09_03430 [Rubripirellula sp.]|nr:hypothetical protein [Rubripirellula sp.]
MTVDLDRSANRVVSESSRGQKTFDGSCTPPTLFSLRCVNDQNSGMDCDSDLPLDKKDKHHNSSCHISTSALRGNDVSTESRLAASVSVSAEESCGQHQEIREPSFEVIGAVAVQNTEEIGGLSRLASNDEIEGEQNVADLDHDRSTGIHIVTTEIQESKPVMSLDMTTERSWLRRIGSHGIVILLLLGVIAAALLTGSDSSRVSPKPSDLLSFDDAMPELSLPEMLQIDLVELQEGNATVANEEFPDTSSEHLNVATATTTQPEDGIGLSEDSKLVAEDRYSFSSSEIGSVENVASVAVVTNDDSQMVKNRNSLLSSLEQLTKKTADAFESTSEELKMPAAPRVTTTPKQIGDWLKFLPPIERIAAETDESVPSIK